MRYAALGAGKRLRPFLVIESARLFDVPAASALRVGAALECVHCYSLVHDDLPAMDDDDMRRGKPTTHKKFDEATAILAGDALLTLAFEILAGSETHPDAAVRSALVFELAKASGMNGMAGGQMLDIEAEAGLRSRWTASSAFRPTRQAPSSALPARPERSWRALIPRRSAASPMISALPSRSPTTCLTWNPRLGSAGQGNAKGCEKRQGDHCFIDGARGGGGKSRSLIASAISALAPLWREGRHTARGSAFHRLAEELALSPSGF